MKLLLILLVWIGIADCKLLSVQILFRHGDRSPRHSFPGDLYSETHWPQGYGQLSSTGVQQLFNLGRWLRSEYSQGPAFFIHPDYIKNEVYVRSTDYERTLMSAESVLAGLFPVNDSSAPSPINVWQPIPVHTVDYDKDFLFKPGPCPRYYELKAKLMRGEDPELQKLFERFKSLQKLISDNTDLPDELTSLFAVYDPIHIESLWNLSLPNWASPSSVAEGLYKAEGIKFKIYNWNEEMIRLSQGGALLRHFIYVMESLFPSKIIQEDNVRKFMLYSAHDSSVAAVLSGLGLYDLETPNYASFLAVELHSVFTSTNTYEPVVVLRYRQATTGNPIILKLPGCKNESISVDIVSPGVAASVFGCPLSKFKSLLTHVLSPSTMDEYNEKCESKEGSPSTHLGSFVVLILLGCAVALGFGFGLAAGMRRQWHRLARMREVDDGCSCAEDLVAKVPLKLSPHDESPPLFGSSQNDPHYHFDGTQIFPSREVGGVEYEKTPSYSSGSTAAEPEGRDDNDNDGDGEETSDNNPSSPPSRRLLSSEKERTSAKTPLLLYFPSMEEQHQPTASEQPRN